MSNTGEKNIVVNRGIPPGNPYGSGGGLRPSRDGWSIGWGGGRGGEGGRAGTLSSSKRRRLRILDKRRRAQEARQRAEAARANAAAELQAQKEANEQSVADAEARVRAQAHAAAELEARREAQAQAAMAAANARAKQEREAAAHRQALESLPLAQAIRKRELDLQHDHDVAALPVSLMSELGEVSSSYDAQRQQSLDAILEHKARINYLIAQKKAASESNRQSSHAFTGGDPLKITSEHYGAILQSRSVSAEQAFQTHQAWSLAYEQALEADLHAKAVTQLLDKSAALSEHYAEQAWKTRNAVANDEILVLKHATEASRLWSMVAGPNAPTQNFPNAAEAAKAIAQKLFIRQAAKALGRSLPQLALLYPTELADGELAPSLIASPASEIGVSSNVDLNFIAGRVGTVDVTHRLRIEEVEGELKTVWAEADGLIVGSKVRVRTFVYNPSAKAYEFKQDGADRPALIWTPAVSPESSSTALPADESKGPEYSGAAILPVSEQLGRFPTYDVEDFEDYILVFPADSGLPPVYVMFNSPRYLPGVVSGLGGDIDPNWQVSASNGLGSPVPSVIADALRGRNYAEFRNLKRAIWREMSKHPEITANMSERNIALIKSGLAPFAARQDRKGGRVKLEIHHVVPISQGGDVYGVDNLRLNTPANHDTIHRDLRNEGRDNER